MKSPNQNVLQRISNSTHGIVTLPNIMSVGGVFATAHGLYRAGNGEMASGLIEAAAGMSLDAFDGMVARKTGTASELGKNVDAICDFGKAGATLMFLDKIGLVPMAYSAAIFAPKLANAVAAAKSVVTHEKPTKVNFDRYVEAARYATIGAMILNNLLHPNQPQINPTNTLIAAPVVIAGAIGSYDQVRRNFNPEKYKEQQRQKAEIKQAQNLRQQMRNFAKATGGAMPRF
jgi:phosphatidylglycerophosphate synthase